MTRKTDGSRSACLGAWLALHGAKIGADVQPYQLGRIVDEMQRATRAAKNWGVRLCNEPMDDRQHDRGMNRIHRMEAKINARLVELFGTDDVDQCPRVEIGGDPRGACGRLLIPGQRGDGWGEGFPIYQEGAR